MKILWSIPHIGQLRAELSRNIVDYKAECEKRGHQVLVVYSSARPYEHNLHRILQKFVEMDFDWWFNTDTDNPPTTNPLLYLEEYASKGVQIVGFPTPIWREDRLPFEAPVIWNVFKDAPNGKFLPVRGEGLLEVDAVGTGCFLMHRDVFSDK